MKNLKKKAFTLVELLVVIAIIAILAVAGVVGYVVFTKKAAQSNDTSLVSQLNEYMAAVSSTDNINTVSDARDILIEDGIDLASLKLTAKGYRAAFDIANKKFVKVNKESPEDYSGKAEDLFVFVSSEADATTFTNAGYSVYLQKGFNATTLNVKSGVDVGENNGFTAISYASTDSKEVVIRTKGDQCVLTIDAPNGDVHFYGFAKKIDVKDVKLTSLHIYGSANQLQVEKGHVEVEDTGIVFDVIQIGTAAAGTGASITNNGFIAETTLSEHTSESAKTAAAATVTGEAVGGDYKISTLAQLESFRDAVNAGNSFEGLTVKLMKDITLNDGWKPIGEGTRKVAAQGLYAGMKFSGNAFKGEFNGNNKIIANLNNKGFIPTTERVSDGIYAYGLFGITTSGANIHDLKLSNVDIDTSRYAIANGDSVGALVGFSAGSITVSNVEVTGTSSIKAEDAVGSIIGRCYNQSGDSVVTVNVSNCKSNATVSANTSDAGNKAAGIIGYVNIRKDGNTDVGCPLLFSGCTFTGTATAPHSGSLYLYGGNVDISGVAQAGTAV